MKIKILNRTDRPINLYYRGSDGKTFAYACPPFKVDEKGKPIKPEATIDDGALPWFKINKKQAILFDNGSLEIIRSKRGRSIGDM